MLRVEKLKGEYYLIDGLESDEGRYLKTVFKGIYSPSIHV